MSVSRLRRMLRLAGPILALVLGAAIAVGLVSCGGRDKTGLLPGNNAQQIIANLNNVDQLASQGNCTEAASEVATVQDEINSLPSSVDPQLRARLTSGAQRLARVVSSAGACETSTQSSVAPPSTPENTQSTTPKKQKPKTTTTTSTTTNTTSTTTPGTSTSTSTAPNGGTPGASGGVPPGQQRKAVEHGGKGGH